MKRATIVEVISSLLILLFVYTALSKLLASGSFHWSIRTSTLLKPYADILVWAVPVSELVIAFLLFFQKTKLIGLLASFFVMLTFTIYIAYMLLTQSELPCSCGGVIKNMNWNQHLIFNICFLLFSVIAVALFQSNDRRPIESLAKAT